MVSMIAICVETIAKVCKQISSNSIQKWNYQQTIHLQIIYVYLFKCVLTNDWCLIITVT